MNNNLPPGFLGGSYNHQMVEHTCPHCGKKWEAAMFSEMGGFFYDHDEEAYCPLCGVEGEYE